MLVPACGGVCARARRLTDRLAGPPIIANPDARAALAQTPAVTLPALRPSFRQLLVVAFLLVASLMAAVSLRGLLTLERLLQQSRDSAEQTQHLNDLVDRLGEHTVTMERAARQYLVLGDRGLLERFEQAGNGAERAVLALAAEALPAELVRDWRGQRQRIRQRLDDSAADLPARDAQLARAFDALERLHGAMAERVRRVAEARNQALQRAQDAGREALARQVAAATVLAGVVALALALWLARPLQRLERAVVALGENRLDQRIDIRGPADVRQLGRRLDWLRQRLAETDADKARFLRHVSHELKTPLAALREGVALLQDGVAGPLTDDQREVARILGDNSATLQRRIEDLLRFNAAAFDAQRLVRKPVALQPFVQALINAQQLQWQARQLQVQQVGGPLTADIDADLMASALGNLLSNAIRFSPPGATILITLARLADGLRIEVADQGPGVAEADRAHIFEPFYRGLHQPDNGLAGTGIGLSIVAETVAAHGGQLQLLPQPADTPAANPAATLAATTFRIDLPHALVD